jgi:HSP20 family protein
MSFREILPWNWNDRRAEDAPGKAGAVGPRQLGDFFDEWFSRPTLRGWPFAEEAGFMPALDAKETEDSIEISVELPGLEEKDLEISISDDQLTIRGEKQEEKKGGEEGAQWVERRFGSFRRVIPIPRDVQADKIQASFKQGVLRIRAPRDREAAPERRTVPIQAG